MQLVRRSAFIFVSAHITLLAGGTFLVHRLTSKELRQGFVERADALALGISSSVHNALCRDARTDIRLLLQEIQQSAKMPYILIRDKNSIIASAGDLSRGGDATKTYASYAEVSPCAAGGAPYELEAGFDFQELAKPLNALSRTQLSIVMIEIVLFLIFSYYVGRRLRRKLSEILDGCRRISSGQFDIELPVTGKDEFSKISQEINATAKSLNELISERERQRAELIANSKMSSLGEMAGGIAHEINNPLAIISGKARSLRRQLTEKTLDRNKMDEALVKIETTAQRVAKIIRGLRTFSRNASGDPMELAKISTMIQDTQELCQERFKNHSIELRINCNTDIELECRPAQICQILINLLSNAHDAVEGLPEKWVSLDVKTTDDQLMIEVMDSGTGIPSEVVEKMMQPFFTTKEVGKGTGLGLSISKGIVDDHHGNFYYDSHSKNTRFVIKLPLRQPSAQTENSFVIKKAA